jgi:hypothetical protein
MTCSFCFPNAMSPLPRSFYPLFLGILISRHSVSFCPGPYSGIQSFTKKVKIRNFSLILCFLLVVKGKTTNQFSMLALERIWIFVSINKNLVFTVQ